MSGDGADYSSGWTMEDASYLYEDQERTVKQKIKVCTSILARTARFFFFVCSCR